MIYFVSTIGQSVVILDEDNIDRMKKGEPVKSPDHSVLVAYCPDVAWLATEMTKIIDGRSIDIEALDALLKEGLNRAPKSVPQKMKMVIPPDKSKLQ